MATIVNTPSAPASDNNASGVGFLIGALVLLFAVFMFFYYGLPALRNATSSSGPSVTVPDKIDVNVNNPSGGSQPNPGQ